VCAAFRTGKRAGDAGRGSEPLSLEKEKKKRGPVTQGEEQGR
jgi:hypothetical protein